jgi:hypothetical protein
VTLDLDSWVVDQVRKVVREYEDGECSLGSVSTRLYDLLEHAGVDDILAPLPWWLRAEVVQDIDQYRGATRESMLFFGGECAGAAYDREAEKAKSFDRFFGKVYPKMLAWHQANTRTDRWPVSVCLWWGDDTVFGPDALSAERPRRHRKRYLTREERKDPVLRQRHVRVRATLEAMAEVERGREVAHGLA